MAKLKCPKCKGTNIQLWNNNLNMKTKGKTTLNLSTAKDLILQNLELLTAHFGENQR